MATSQVRTSSSIKSSFSFHSDERAFVTQQERGFLRSSRFALCNNPIDAFIWWITSEMYDKIHQEYQDTLTRLLHEKQKYSEGKSEYELSIATIFSLAKRAKEIFESSEVGEKKKLLKFLLQNPVIDSKKPLYNLESPFDLVLEMSDKNVWLGY